MSRPTEQRIIDNISVSLAVNVLNLILRFFLPPIILHYLSLSEYGLWSICFVLLGYVGMSTTGIGNVYLRYFAVYLSKKQLDNVNKLFATGFYTTAAIAVLLFILMTLFIDPILQLLNVSPFHLDEARLLILSTLFFFLLFILTSIFANLLDSMQRFKKEKVNFLISSFVEFILTIVFLYLGFGVLGLAYAFGFRIILSALLNYRDCRKLIPKLDISPRNFDLPTLKLFWAFGSVVQLSSIFSIINASFEKMVAALFLGPSAVALYDIGEKFPLSAISLPSVANEVFLPTSASMFAKEEHDKILNLYIHGSRWISISTGIMMGFLAPFSYFIISCWLGYNPKYAMAATILAIFTIAYQINVMTGPASAIYRGINRPWREFQYPFSQFVLCVAACALLFYLYGASFNTINIAVASMMVLSGLLYVVQANRFLELSQISYLREVLAPGLVCYGAGYLIEWISESWGLSVVTNRILTFVYLACCLTLYLAAVIPLIYFLLCDDEDRARIKEIFFSFLPYRRVL